VISMLSDIELRAVALFEMANSLKPSEADAAALVHDLDDAEISLLIGTMIGIWGRLAACEPDMAEQVLTVVRSRALQRSQQGD